MRIAVVAPHTTQICRPEVEDEVERLDEWRRFHVFLIASNLRKAGVDAEFFYLTRKRSIYKRVIEDTPVTFCPVSWLSKKEFGWELSFSLLSELRKFQPDLIHTFHYAPPTFWWLVICAKSLKVPLITTHVASDWSHNLAKRLRGRVFEKICDFFTKKADRIIINCNQREINWLTNDLGYSPEKIVELISYGTSTEFFHPLDKDFAMREIGLDRGYKYLLSVCLIRTPSEMRKNPFELLYVLKILKEKQNQFHFKLIVVGSGPKENVDYFIDTAKRLRVFDDVIMTGYIASEERLSYYFNAADVYLNTSEKDSGYGKKNAAGKEAVIFDAMACGIPNITYASEYHKDDGCMIYVPNRDRELMAEKVIELMEDSKLRHKLVKNSLRDIREHGTWPKISESLKKEYNKILKEWLRPLSGYAFRFKRV